MVENYRTFREKYDPLKKGNPIKVLFVAESPPKPKNKGILPYFYNKDSKQKGGLWFYFNKALYNGMMSSKEEFLKRFQDDGYFLIDVFPTRQDLDKLKRDDYVKIAKISQDLFDRIKELDPEKVVFIGKRSAKLIAGCLPFGNNSNKESFYEFVRASIKD